MKDTFSFSGVQFVAIQNSNCFSHFKSDYLSTINVDLSQNDLASFVNKVWNAKNFLDVQVMEIFKLNHNIKIEKVMTQFSKAFNLEIPKGTIQ